VGKWHPGASAYLHPKQARPGIGQAGMFPFPAAGGVQRPATQFPVTPTKNRGGEKNDAVIVKLVQLPPAESRKIWRQLFKTP